MRHNNVKSILTTILLLLFLPFAGPALASPGSVVTIVNNEGVPIVIESTSQVNCIDIDGAGIVGAVRRLEPGQSTTFNAHRSHRGSCDGAVGQFVFKFSTATSQPLKRQGYMPTSVSNNVNDGNHLCLIVHHGGGMERNRGCPNNLPVNITPGSGGYYTVATLGLTRGVVLEVGDGYWDLVCSDFCNASEIRQNTSSQTDASSFSESERREISSTIEAGWEGKAFSVSSSVTASVAQEVARSTSREFTSGRSFTRANNFAMSLDDMAKYNVGALWNWVVPLQGSSVGDILVRSPEFVCTTGRRDRPNYNPGEQPNRTCSGGLVSSNTGSNNSSSGGSSAYAPVLGPSDIVGVYELSPYENAWHRGSIQHISGNEYRWNNTAGISWSLTLDLGSNTMKTGTDNPYYADYEYLREFRLQVSGTTVSAFEFGNGGGIYYKQ